MLSTPLSSITTISPASISLTNSAPMASNAQLSEARTYISSSAILPKHNGLNPSGSRTPISLSFIIIPRAKQPFNFSTVLKTASLYPYLPLILKNFSIISVSIAV